MTDKSKILIQIDSDPQPSCFDRIVALDSGADQVLAYGGVTLEQVQNLVHGAIFTRGGQDLMRTAIFVGGSDMGRGEQLMNEALRHMLPQMGLRVSIMLDGNGANTTAAAAVCVARRHLEQPDTRALVLGGTGPVGVRVARLLAGHGADVRIGSRHLPRAEQVCANLRVRIPTGRLQAVATGSPAELTAALADRNLVISAGAAGVLLLPRVVQQASPQLKVAIDLNAVPPFGIELCEAMDRGTPRDGAICYGAYAVGSLKMKIHRAAIALLFASNKSVLDAEALYDLALTTEPER